MKYEGCPAYGICSRWTLESLRETCAVQLQKKSFKLQSHQNPSLINLGHFNGPYQVFTKDFHYKKNYLLKMSENANTGICHNKVSKAP